MEKQKSAPNYLAVKTVNGEFKACAGRIVKNKGKR